MRLIKLEAKINNVVVNYSAYTMQGEAIAVCKSQFSS